MRLHGEAGVVRSVYPAGEAARLADIPYATLDFWDRIGFISPSVALASGKGTDRLYSFADVIRLRAASELRRIGVDLQTVRSCLEQMPAIQGPEPITVNGHAFDGAAGMWLTFQKEDSPVRIVLDLSGVIRAVGLE